ncbi:MAG: hypothetical protein ACYCYI_06485 [Saccharofermentanales bacterium]
MKKSFILFLCFSMIFTIISCDKKQPDKTAFTMTTGNPTAWESEYIFLEGYIYNSNLSGMKNEIGTDEKGEKIGEVLLDLTLKDLKGTPPDFSARQLELGTPIYEHKNYKKDYAVVASFSEDIDVILYCIGFANRDSYDGMEVSDVIRKISSYPKYLGIFPKTLKVIAVEFSDKGKIDKKLTDKDFISRINKELPDLEFQSEPEQVHTNEKYILMTLILDNNLEIPLHTKGDNAFLFNGYVKMPEELLKSIQNASKDVIIEKIMD